MFGSAVSGLSAKLTVYTFLPVPSVREQGAAVGLTVGLLNHQAHNLISKIKTVVAGIYGLGPTEGDWSGENPTLADLVTSKGGKMFSSHFPDGSPGPGVDGDAAIISYLLKGYKQGKSSPGSIPDGSQTSV